MDKPEWPTSLKLRDTKVYADEGQRIFTTATGHGYERQEYVRSDVVEQLILKAKNDAYEEAAAVADPIDTDERMSDYEKQAYDLRDVISQAIRNLKHEG